MYRKEVKVLIELDDKGLYDHSFLLVRFEAQVDFSVCKRCKDFFQFGLISLERIEPEKPVIQLFFQIEIFLKRRKKSFLRGKCFFDEEQAAPFVADEESVANGIGKTGLEQ